jgi:hypothetical protein
LDEKNTKGADFLCRGTFAPVHAERETEDDFFGAPFFSDPSQLGEDVALSDFDGSDGMGRDAKIISGRQTDTGVTVIDGKNGVHWGSFKWGSVKC